MQEPWDPLTTDVATVIKRIRDGSIQAYYEQQSFQEHQLVPMLETPVSNTGQFACQYEQWRLTEKHPHAHTFIFINNPQFDAN